MRLIAYTRVSTEDQAQHGHSLGQQPTRILAWAKANGHEIVAFVSDDGVSASIPLFDRPGGRELRRFLLADHVDGVVAQRLDRLFRSARDGLAFAEDFAVRYRVALLTVDGAIDTSTPTGWLMAAMQLVTAQYARLMDVQRATETTRSLRESGRVYGHVPYGCIEVGRCTAADGKVHPGRLLRERSAWNIRAEIVDMRRSGVTVEDGGGGELPLKPPVSYRTLRDILHARGTPSPTGSAWWSLATLRTLVETHADLAHLPLADDVTAPRHSTPEAEVSSHV